MCDLLYQLVQSKVKAEIRRAYEAGIAEGYQLGRDARQAENRNIGIIMGANVDRQVREICNEKGIL